MSLPSHPGANCAAVRSPLRVALRAAASVHCGKPPTSPVLRALPARFFQAETGADGMAGGSTRDGTIFGAVAWMATGDDGVGKADGAGGGATARAVGAIGEMCVGVCGVVGGAGARADAEVACHDPALVRSGRTKRARASVWCSRLAAIMLLAAEFGDEAGEVAVT